MIIFLNSNQTEVADKLALETFLQQQGLSDKKGIAVAVNNQVVNRQNWSNCVLKEEDKVLVIKASQGG